MESPGWTTWVKAHTRAVLGMLLDAFTPTISCLSSTFNPLPLLLLCFKLISPLTKNTNSWNEALYKTTSFKSQKHEMSKKSNKCFYIQTENSRVNGQITQSRYTLISCVKDDVKTGAHLNFMLFCVWGLYGNRLAGIWGYDKCSSINVCMFMCVYVINYKQILTKHGRFISLLFFVGY